MRNDIEPTCEPRFICSYSEYNVSGYSHTTTCIHTASMHVFHAVEGLLYRFVAYRHRYVNGICTDRTAEPTVSVHSTQHDKASPDLDLGGLNRLRNQSSNDNASRRTLMANVGLSCVKQVHVCLPPRFARVVKMVAESSASRCAPNNRMGPNITKRSGSEDGVRPVLSLLSRRRQAHTVSGR